MRCDNAAALDMRHSRQPASQWKFEYPSEGSESSVYLRGRRSRGRAGAEHPKACQPEAAGDEAVGCPEQDHADKAHRGKAALFS